MREKSQSLPDETRYESSSSNVWLLKLWAPLFWLIWTVALFKDDVFSIRILGSIPFVLAFAFHMSLAVVRIRDGAVEYRRFLRWRRLARTEVTSSGVIWSPFIGYLRLQKPQPPWGRLFFVLDSHSARRSDRREGLGIVAYLRQNEEVPPRALTNADYVKGVRYGQLIAAGVCGVIASFLRVYLSQTPGTAEPTSHGHPMVDWAVRALAYIGNPQLAIPLLAALLVLTILFRRRRLAWSFAFLAGLVTPFVFCSNLMR